MYLISQFAQFRTVTTYIRTPVRNVRFVIFVAEEVNDQPETNEKIVVNLDLRYPRKMSDVQEIQKKFNDILDSKPSSKPLEDVDEEIETLPMLPDPIKAEESIFQGMLKKR